MIYRLTETLHYVTPKSAPDAFDTGGMPTSLSPGLVDGDWLRGQIGEPLLEHLIRHERLVPEP